MRDHRMTKNWIIFYFIWGTALAVALLSVLLKTDTSLLLSNKFVLINTFQRLTGLLMFVLITTQIVLGAFMTKWTDLFGGKIFKFHTTEGVVAYIFMLTHPTLAMLAGFGIFPLFKREYLIYDLGKLAFVLFTISVFAAIFRTRPFLAKHWRKFHILNYFTFYLVAIHSFFAGTDTQNFPFIIVYWICVGVVSLTVLLKLKYLLVEQLLPRMK